MDMTEKLKNSKRLKNIKTLNDTLPMYSEYFPNSLVLL